MNGPQSNPDPSPDPRPTAPAPASDVASTRGPAPGEATVELARLLDGYLAELESGGQPDRDRLIADHPRFAAQLGDALAGLDFIHRAAPRAEAAPARLGDFKIVREIGRGGMGVVYEAEQISLKRRVALKVLRHGPVADEVAMQRFQREAETVGRLHHTNIVPIHAIGAESGVRYYAMQYIDGRDLGRVAQEARTAGTALAPREVAAWGIQAADALAHGDLSGVIQPEIQPSNLILDPEQRIWLTDFGLARRLDDVSLSLTGAMLGTPRYMSPEQAAAATTSPVDHRTDIYSLGATLYELVAGRPIFEATTPHEVIAQILHAEPRALRPWVPGLPRDLETIILKCLAKEPSRRYDTALSLADDLRAFAAGRGILARRPALAERSARWLKLHRRSVLVGSLSAAIALVLAYAGIGSWSSYRDARQARLHLDGSQPNLLAEILDDAGRPVTGLLPVPTGQPVSLGAGRYELRLSASGMPSESWPLDLTPRAELRPQVQLADRWLWSPRELGAVSSRTVPVVSGSHADFLVHVPGEARGDREPGPIRVRWVDGSTGASAWPADLVFDAAHLPPGGDAAEWQGLLGQNSIAQVFTDTGIPERVARLDDDGTADVVLVSRTTPSLLAVSGATGEVLWWHRGRPGAGTESPRDPSARWAGRLYQGFVVGNPLRLDDLDGDEVPEFAACFRSNGEKRILADGSFRSIPGGSWVSVISGRAGTLLWQRPVAEDWSDYGSSSSALAKHGPLARLQLAQVGGRPTLFLPDQGRLRQWSALDGSTAAADVDPGFPIFQAPRIQDLDADGSPEALFVHRQDSAFTDFELVVIELPGGRVRWRHPLLHLPGHQGREVASAMDDLLVLEDLDADGRPEILATTQRRDGDGPWSFGVEVRDGGSGTPLWTRTLQSRTDPQSQPDHTRLSVGPDLRRDGKRALFVARAAYDEHERRFGIQVTALSGSDGREIWSRHLPDAGAPRAITWCQKGTDTWPMLVVTTVPSGGQRDRTWILRAGSGEVAHTILDVGKVDVADFDGDGIPDLTYALGSQGSIRTAVVQGRPPDAWRGFGEWIAGSDVDGNGAVDLFGIDSEHRLVARSGRGGQRLWQGPPEQFASPAQLFLPPNSFAGKRPILPGLVVTALNRWTDLDPVTQGRSSYRALAAFSSSEGKRLWVATNDVLGHSGTMGSTMNWAFAYPRTDLLDLDQDAIPEILITAHDSSNQLRLSVVGGKDGRRWWSTPVLDGAMATDPRPAGAPLADFNRDGVPDFALVLPPKPPSSGSPAPATSSPPEAEFHVAVLDGRSGRPLWRAPFAVARDRGHLAWPEPTVGDLDGDGIPEVIVVRHRGLQQPDGFRCDLIVLDGGTGQVRWTWSWVTGSLDLWAPVLVQRPGKGSTRIALGVAEPGRSRIVVLDAKGDLVGQRRVQSLGARLHSAGLCWRAADLDGDGLSELMFADEAQLHVADPVTLQSRWSWKFTTPAEYFRVLEPESAVPGRPATVVLWDGNQVYGLEGATGVALWRGFAPGSPVWGNSSTPQLTLRRLGPNPELPALEFGFPTAASDFTRIAGTWPTSPDGRFRAPRNEERRTPGLSR